MDAGPSSLTSAAFLDASNKNGRQHLQRARRGATVAGSSRETDQIILDEMKKEFELGPCIPAASKFIFTTSLGILPPHSKLPHVKPIDSRKGYFDRPEVLAAFREQRAIETPDFQRIEPGMVIHSVKDVRIEQTGIEDTSDAGYARRHKKFERKEKGIRLRDVERLQNKQYHLHERIEQLRSLDTASFLNFDKSYFLETPLDDVEDIATLQNRTSTLSLLEIRDGERRRKQMLRAGKALEERLRSSLLPRKKRPATFAYSPVRRTNALPVASASAAAEPTNDSLNTPAPRTVKKPFMPALPTEDQYTVIADTNQEDEMFISEQIMIKKRKNKAGDADEDDWESPIAKKKKAPAKKKTINGPTKPRNSLSKQPAMTPFKIKLPATRQSTPKPTVKSNRAPQELPETSQCHGEPPTAPLIPALSEIPQRSSPLPKLITQRVSSSPEPAPSLGQLESKPTKQVKTHQLTKSAPQFLEYLEPLTSEHDKYKPQGSTSPLTPVEDEDEEELLARNYVPDADIDHFMDEVIPLENDSVNTVQVITKDLFMQVDETPTIYTAPTTALAQDVSTISAFRFPPYPAPSHAAPSDVPLPKVTPALLIHSNTQEYDNFPPPPPPPPVRSPTRPKQTGSNSSGSTSGSKPPSSRRIGAAKPSPVVQPPPPRVIQQIPSPKAPTPESVPLLVPPIAALEPEPEPISQHPQTEVEAAPELQIQPEIEPPEPEIQPAPDAEPPNEPQPDTPTILADIPVTISVRAPVERTKRRGTPPKGRKSHFKADKTVGLTLTAEMGPTEGSPSLNRKRRGPAKSMARKAALKSETPATPMLETPNSTSHVASMLLPSERTSSPMSTSYRRSITMQPDASSSRKALGKRPEPEPLILLAARRTRKFIRHNEAFGTAVPEALFKNDLQYALDDSDDFFKLPDFITEEPMVKTGMERIERECAGRVAETAPIIPQSKKDKEKGQVRH